MSSELLDILPEQHKFVFLKPDGTIQFPYRILETESQAESYLHEVIRAYIDYLSQNPQAKSKEEVQVAFKLLNDIKIILFQ